MLVVCEYCKCDFFKITSSVNRNKKLGYSNYCSIECMKKSYIKKSQIMFQCAQCGKNVLCTKAELKKRKGKSQKGKLFCSHSCAQYANARKGENHPMYNVGKSLYRRKALNFYGSKCTVCGYNIEKILEVHHRDGNRNNNKIENLDVLCPTHHNEYQFGIRD